MYMVSKFYLVRGFMDDIKSYVSSGGIHSSHLRLLGLGPALQLHRRSDHVHRVAGLCLPVRFTGVVATHSIAIGPFQVPKLEVTTRSKAYFQGKSPENISTSWQNAMIQYHSVPPWGAKLPRTALGKLAPTEVGSGML